jgi:hypothetical protein
MNFRPQVKHLYQTNGYNCGATAFASIFDCTIKEAEKLLRTTKTGTSTKDVCKALKSLEQPFFFTSVERDFCEIRDILILLSCRFPLYVSCAYHYQGKRGRTRIRYHAVIFANGNVYDPDEVRVCPMDCCEHTFDKKMVVDDMIVIQHELPDFLKNFKLMAS